MKYKWFMPTLMAVLVVAICASAASAQDGDVARGQQLYLKNCAVCHGERAEGRIGATLAKDFPGIRVDALLKQTISNGVDGSKMSAWSKSKGGPLADSEIDDIVAFIRSLGNQGPTVPSVPVPTRIPVLPTASAKFPTGDATRGAIVYAQNCIMCHGDKGEGRIGATLQKDWSGINIDALLDTTIARGVAGSKMPPFAKSNGGPLTDQEIADAVAFVRTLKPSTAPASAPATTTPIPEGGALGGVLGLACFVILILLGLLALGIVFFGARSRPATD